MKKIFTAALTVLLLAGCNTTIENSGPTILEGKVADYHGQYFTFLFLVDGEYLQNTIEVAEDGTFCDTLETVYNGYEIPVLFDRTVYRIAMDPGKSYKAEFDFGEGVEEKIHFIGEGEKENRFMDIYWSDFRSTDKTVEPHTDCEAFGEYLGYINEKSDPLYSLLKKIDNKGFVEYYTNALNTRRFSYIFFYPFIKIANTGAYTPDKQFLRAAKKASKLPEEEWSIMLNVVSANAPYLFPKANLYEVLRATQDFSSDPARQDEAMEKILARYMSAGVGKNFKEAYEFYKENASAINEKLSQSIESSMAAFPGSVAPEFEFEDINGGIHHLADFQGKPLYIDFWASWCGPCCAEIPYLQKLVNELGEDPEITCISISIDKVREEWTTKLAEENSTWPQFIATEEGRKTITKVYGVNSIPRFILIKSDGTIASLSASRPSSDNILQDLKDSLE